MNVTGTEISMIRGNSESITLALEENGTSIPFESDDTVYFTIKKRLEDTENALQKVITVFDEGSAVIEITPEDTKSLELGEYIYDIQLTRADGKITTIIPPSLFLIEGEVTRE